MSAWHGARVIALHSLGEVVISPVPHGASDDPELLLGIFDMCSNRSSPASWPGFCVVSPPFAAPLIGSIFQGDKGFIVD